jgi:hypothetical protein
MRSPVLDHGSAGAPEQVRWKGGAEPEGPWGRRLDEQLCVSVPLSSEFLARAISVMAGVGSS